MKPNCATRCHLGQQRVETLLNTIVRDERLQAGFVLRPRHRKERAIRGRADERRVFLLRQLVEARVEHRREQLVHHDRPVAADRSLVAGRTEVREGHGGRRHFLVGDDGIARARLLGDVERRTRPLADRILQSRETLLDLGHDGVAIDIADDDHRHQVRTVPIAIEAHQGIARDLADDVRVADGTAFRVAGSLELDRTDLVPRPLAGAEVHAPLGQDDGALTVDGVLVEGRAAGPVVQNQQRAVERGGHVGRDAQRVLRVVVAGLGVGVGAQPKAERGEEITEALAREVLRALEFHVLDEMRDPELVVVFEDGSGLHHQPQLGFPGGLGVGTNVVAHTVRQRADRGLRVHRHGPREWIGGDRFGGGFAAARLRRLGVSRGRAEQREKDKNEGSTPAYEGHSP